MAAMIKTDEGSYRFVVNEVIDKVGKKLRMDGVDGFMYDSAGGAGYEKKAV